MELDQESARLFVFKTPFGFFKFKHLIQGISPTSGECHEILRKVVKGIPGIAQIKDNLVLHGKGVQHDERLEKLLKRSSQDDITFHLENCKFGQDQVTWFGNVYTKDGMGPDPQKV